MRTNSVIAGGMFLFFGIAFGAFGAHALKESLTAEQLVSFETGVRYMIYHGLGLLALGLAADKFTFDLKIVSGMLMWGTLLFSGSIFLLTTKHLFGGAFIASKYIGPITPIGGVLLLSGWLGFLIAIINVKNKSRVDE